MRDYLLVVILSLAVYTLAVLYAVLWPRRGQ